MKKAVVKKGRNTLPADEKKVQVKAGYCKKRNKDKIEAVIKPIVAKMDKE